MINDGKKMIAIYINGDIIIWNLTKLEKEKTNSGQYQFTVFRNLERRILSMDTSMIQLPDSKNLILCDANSNLLYITNRRVVTSMVPSSLHHEENVSRIISCFDSQCFILISNDKRAKLKSLYISVESYLISITVYN